MQEVVLRRPTLETQWVGAHNVSLDRLSESIDTMMHYVLGTIIHDFPIPIGKPGRLHIRHFRRNTEITDHDRLRVIADRCLPALGWCAVASAIVEALRYLDRAAMGSCSAPHAEQWTAIYGAAGPG